jgi:PGF-pre-PGF domain-containing protein
VNGTCEEPSSIWLESYESEKSNPGCWIFDNAKTKCQNVTGCGWIANSSSCVGLEEVGIDCENITDSDICSKLPVLRTCCQWTNNTCKTDKVSTKCSENLQPPPEGATFCGDYNAYTSNSTCKQIAGEPWYMPCKWSDMGTSDTSDDRCVFRSEEKFGGEMKDLKKITSKKDCEYAGGEWKVEYYCEGDKAVPYGWCEMKTGVDANSCDAACWACESQANGTRWNSSSEAMAACKASALGYCAWRNDINAPNGFGYCEVPEDIKAGKGDCNTDCIACEKKTSPKTACEQTAANCKWVEDKTNSTTIGGWCYPKQDKSCSEDCFKCYDEVSCVNYGKGTKGSCVWSSDTKICKPTNFDKEICFDGIDNDGNGLVDCTDPNCFSDSFCGGNMISNCWNYDTQANCAGNGTVENCMWIKDTFTGKEWCGMKGENCFMWDGDQTGCDAQTGICQWYTDPKGGFCDNNKTKVETCFKLTTEGSCKANSDCVWTTDTKSTTGGKCEFKTVKCSSYANLQCQNVTYCSWEVDQFNATKGSCLSKCDYYTMQGSCGDDKNCQWMSGFCDPADALGMKMGDCWKFTNETACGIAVGCEWYVGKTGPARNCDFNLTLERDVCGQKFNSSACTAVSACKWNSIPGGTGGWCDLKIHGCGWYGNQTDCAQDPQGYGGCVWKNVTFEYGGGMGGGVGGGGGQQSGRCEPKCFNENLPENQCTGSCAPTGAGGGKCESKMAKTMFSGMESPPVPLGMDNCNEATLGGEYDICGFGVKDSPDNYGIGTMVRSMEYAALCKGQQVMTNKATGTTTTGSGANTTKFYWYIGTDGSETGGCAAYHNVSSVGWEFFFKYKAELVDGSLKETRTAYKCDNGEWVVTDIKATGWQTLMCEEVGGAMISIDKSSLSKFPDLYKPEKKMRVLVATGNKTTTEINPVDVAGPGSYNPGSTDFKFEDCMMPGVDMDGDGMKSENDPDCAMFQKFGFIRYEDCFETGVDEDGNGLTDCFDPSCKFASNCAGKGVNAANYTDVDAPTLKWKEVKVFPDAATIKFDTDEPANGTVQFYLNSSNCAETALNKTIKDTALFDSDTWNDFKNWHDASVDNFDANPQKLGYALVNGTTYYYKIKICDSTNNCGVSACLNFTTAKSSNKKDCPDCQFTIKLTGANIQLDFGSGFSSMDNATAACGGTGMRGNYTSSTANVKMVGNHSEILFQNATISGLDSSVNLTEGTITNGSYTVGYVGMPSENFDELAGKMSPRVCIIQVPKSTDGTCDSVWKCDDYAANCINVTANSTLLNDTATYCEWKIPCDFSLYKAGTPAPTGGTTTTIGGTTTIAGGSTGATGLSGAVPALLNIITSRGKVRINVPSIVANKATVVSITKTDEMSVMSINITVNKAVNLVNINITKEPGMPASVTKEIVGKKVYHYMTINKANITDDDISKLKINFKVEKSWITANDINVNTIVLNRFEASGTWNTLVTKKLSEDNETVYFEAESPGLSVFAIAGETTGAATTTATTTVTTAPTQTTAVVTTTIVAPPIKGPGLSLIYIIVISVIAVFVLLMFVFFRGGSSSEAKSKIKVYIFQ